MLAKGAVWPATKPATEHAETPGLAEALAMSVEVAENLRRAMSGRNISEIARLAQVARSTIYDIVSGTTWPDLVTVCKLEAALEEQLWPRRSGTGRRR